MNEEKKISLRKVALKIDISTETLRRWYKWYEDDDYEKPEGLELPSYTVDSRQTKFFSESDVKVLRKFKSDLQGKYRGIMSDFNAKYQWGKYGSAKLEKKAGNEND
jgi:transposase-like protein